MAINNNMKRSSRNALAFLTFMIVTVLVLAGFDEGKEDTSPSLRRLDTSHARFVSSPPPKNRDLKSSDAGPHVEVLGTYLRNAALVRVRPTFVGPCPAEEEEGSAPLVTFFVATYLTINRSNLHREEDDYYEYYYTDDTYTDDNRRDWDREILRECKFARDVDSCYYMDILVPCFRTLTLYARAPSLSRKERVDNPKVGDWCFPQDFPTIGRARSVSIDVDCPWPPSNVECSKNADCPKGVQCVERRSYKTPSNIIPEVVRTGEYYCSPVADIGEACEPGDSFTSFKWPCGSGGVCRNTHICDIGGQKRNYCVAHGAHCTGVNDPNCDLGFEYCDILEQKCLPYLKRDDCCSSDHECSPGLKCLIGESSYEWQKRCRIPCDASSDCDEDEKCTDFENYVDAYIEYYPGIPFWIRDTENYCLGPKDGKFTMKVV